MYTTGCVRGRVHGPCIQLCTGRVLGRVRAVSDRVDGRVRALYTARVDKHVHGCACDVYTTVYMARYGRVHGPRPQRAVSARVHGRVGLPAMYMTVYWPCTRPFNCGVDACTCRTAV